MTALKKPPGWEPRINKLYTPDGQLVWQKIQRTPDGEWEDYFPPPEQEQVRDAIVYGTGITKDGKRIDPASIYKQPEREPDFIHETNIVRHSKYPSLAVQFGEGIANIRLTFDGETGNLKAAEVLA